MALFRGGWGETAGGGGGICRIASETWRWVGFPDDRPSSRGSLTGFSETVFALAGTFDPRLGGRGSGGWENPNILGSFLSVSVGLLAKPIMRASFGRTELCSAGINGVGCAITLAASAGASACLRGGKGGIGGAWSGLREGELSSLLGGVLKGDTLASKEGLRGSGCRTLGAGTAIAVGFAGIFGLSARLTGGGLAGVFVSCVSTVAGPASSAFPTSARSLLAARGAGVGARLEC